MLLLGPDDDLVAHLGHPPRRLTVAGVSGAGKTTLSRRIAARLDLPFTEIDGLFHGPGWAPRETFLEDVRAVVGQDAFVTEWQYRAVRPLILERVEVVVWLDLPTRVTMRQVIGRTWRRARTQEELWNGNTEPGFRYAFTRPDGIVRWAWDTRNDHRGLPQHVQETAPHVVVVRLRSREEVERWVRRLPTPPAG